MNVNAIEQRAGNAVQVLLYLSGVTDARFRGVVIVTARAGIHRGNQHETCRIFYTPFDARDADLPVLQRLSEYLKRVPAEFGQLVEEQNSVVRQADFSRLWGASAAYEGYLRNGVVRRTKRSARNERRVFA